MDAFFFPFQSRAAELLQRPEFVDCWSRGRWTSFPKSPDPAPVEKWFLELANKVLAVGGSGRQYSASPATPLTGHCSSRKPDLILLPRPLAVGPVNWSDVLVVGEMKKSQRRSLEVDTMVELANYIRIMFAKRVRRFIHGFTFCGEFMRCWVFHRGGAMGSVDFNIHNHPQQFLSVILGYGTMSDTELGFDTTLLQEGIVVGPMTEKITLTHPAFFCPLAIASRGTTCWNATFVTDSLMRLVLKDSWRSIHHGSEGEMLAKAQQCGVVGIVEYVAHEDVMMDGKPDDLFNNVMKGLQVGKAINLVLPLSRTDSREGESDQGTPSPESRRNSVLSLALQPAGSGGLAAIDDEDPLTPPGSSHTGRTPPMGEPKPSSIGKRVAAVADDERSFTSPSPKRVKSSTNTFRPYNRIHTRLLTKQGRDIREFTSIRELLLAFHGAITGHRSLYQNGILHRDVSINNIMMAHPDCPRPDGLAGFLIDLDLAIGISTIDRSGAPHRTGTKEFMAIGALRGDVHTFRHDLESFFYVFLWICIQYPIFPGDKAKAKGRVWKPVLNQWASTFECAAAAKWGDMGRAGMGSGLGLERLLEKFEDWAMVLHGLARGIRDVLFPVIGGTMGFSEGLEVYDEILNLFQEHAERF